MYFSSAAFGRQTLPEIVEECLALDVGLEFTSSFEYRADLVEHIGRIRGLPLLVHNYFPPPAEPFVLNLAATDPAIRSASLNLCREAIELSAQIGGTVYGVHAGFAMNLTATMLGQPEQQAALPPEALIPPARAMETFRQAVLDLAAFAQTCGVRLLLENNVITPQQVAAGRGDSLLLTTPDGCREFFAGLDDPSVGLLLDTGHARVSAQAFGFDPAEFLRGDLPLGGIHLSDNDGTRDSNRPFGPDAWFAPSLRRFAELPITVEVYGLDHEGRRRQRDVLSSLLQ